MEIMTTNLQVLDYSATTTTTYTMEFTTTNLQVLKYSDYYKDLNYGDNDYQHTVPLLL